jgi:hypothetical protein
MFGISVFATIAALAVLAILTNRKGKHVALGALLWMCAGTVLVWGALILLMRR